MPENGRWDLTLHLKGLTTGYRTRAGVDVATKRKFVSFLGYRSGNSQPNGCARVQTEDRFVAPLTEARNGMQLYSYFAPITFCF
jgi:hypothetical protein